MKVWDKFKSLGMDKMLTNMKDYHMAIFVLMFFIGCAIAIWKPASMTYQFVAFTGTIAGAITGHAFSPPARSDADVDPAATTTTTTTTTTGS